MSEHVYREDCFEWPAGRGGPQGHGMLHSRRLGKRVYAHRVVYEATFGPIPEGMVVRHKCDNPPCINPNHLEVGTQADNIRDMCERGRSTAVLIGPVVDEVRDRHLAGESFDAIGRDIGVSSVTVGSVCADINPGRGSHVKKLTWDDRREICRRSKEGERHMDLAETFGVTPAAITYTVKQGAKKAC